MLNDSHSAPPLGDMTPEDFRRHGHQIIDWISDYLADTERYDVLPNTQPGDVRARLPRAAPQHGEAFDLIFSDVENIIAPNLTHWNHPAFFAYFAINATAPGIFGELLAAAFNVNQMLWRTSPAATELEQTALEWLRQMLGLSDDFQGIIYDTASISSLHALAAAREKLNLNIREQGLSGRAEALPQLVAYTSEQSHSSIEKALILLGHGQNSLRKIKTDNEFRLDTEALAQAIRQDKQNGALPFCVVATVGTTSTTSIDPVSEIADICERENLWLHVDAAYAGSAAVADEYKHILDNCNRADSLVTNPHKWLFTPFDCSVLYTRHTEILRQAFALVPDYLKTSEQDVMNGMDYGIQLGRRFRSLKLWMVMRYFGQQGLAARIREHCRLAKQFATWVDDSKDFETLAPVPFSTICFRFHPKDKNLTDAKLDALNEQLINFVNTSGKAFISHTRLNNRLTIRLAIGHIRTTEQHLKIVWELLTTRAATLKSEL